MDGVEKEKVVSQILDRDLYFNNVFNELVWHRRLGNVEMERYLIKNYLNFGRKSSSI